MTDCMASPAPVNVMVVVVDSIRSAKYRTFVPVFEMVAAVRNLTGICTVENLNLVVFTSLEIVPSSCSAFPLIVRSTSGPSPPVKRMAPKVVPAG